MLRSNLTGFLNRQRPKGWETLAFGVVLLSCLAVCYVALVGGAFLIIQTSTGGWFWLDTVLSTRIHSFSIVSGVIYMLSYIC